MIEEELVIQDEQELAEEEAYYWEDLLEKVRKVNSEVDSRRSDTIHITQNSLTPEYDKVESILYDVEQYIKGRIEELTPGWYKSSYEGRHYMRTRYGEAMQYAYQEGINYIPLSRIYGADRQIDAIEYISEHHKASRNYDATCRAVIEYEKARPWR